MLCELLVVAFCIVLCIVYYAADMLVPRYTVCMVVQIPGPTRFEGRFTIDTSACRYPSVRLYEGE